MFKEIIFKITRILEINFTLYCSLKSTCANGMQNASLQYIMSTIKQTNLPEVVIKHLVKN